MRFPPISTWPPLACVAAAGYCAVQAIIEYNGLQSLALLVIVPPVVLVALAVTAHLVRGAVYGGHRVNIPTHSHDPNDGEVERQDVRDHEAGHWVVGRELGGHGGQAVARSDGSGYVRMNFRRRLTVVERIAISRAGALAEGSESGAYFDNRNIRDELRRRRVPRAQQWQARADGERLAADILRRRAGKVRAVAKSLRTGRHT